MSKQPNIPELEPESEASQHGIFPLTAWSMLLQGKGDPEETHGAWEQLARDYWKPLYILLRGRGCNHETAADDVQGFFEHLLNRDFMRRIERGDGLFRSFLLTTLQHWRTDQHRAATAQKRGGGVCLVPLEDLEAIGASPIGTEGSPEENYDRRWAHTVYDNALTTLRERLKYRGREPQFQKLHGLLTGQGIDKYREIATLLGMSEGAVKQTALEMRREFGAVLRDEIRRTVVDEEQVDGEIRYLLGLLRM